MNQSLGQFEDVSYWFWHRFPEIGVVCCWLEGWTGFYQLLISAYVGPFNSSSWSVHTSVHSTAVVTVAYNGLGQCVLVDHWGPKCGFLLLESTINTISWSCSYAAGRRETIEMPSSLWLSGVDVSIFSLNLCQSPPIQQSWTCCQWTLSVPRW